MTRPLPLTLLAVGLLLLGYGAWDVWMQCNAP